MNLKHKKIEHVRILAKEAAAKNKEDQRIYETTWKGHVVFDFCRAKDKKRGIEVVPYTRPVEHKDVLQDNGDEQPKPVKKRTPKNSKTS